MNALARLFALILAYSGMATAAEPSAEVKALVGHWTMDDAVGMEVRDSSPNPLHGVFTADTAPSSRPGKVGRALDFPGNAFVDLSPHAARLGKLRNFTLSLWIQHRPGPSRMLFSWSDGTTNHRIQAEVHDSRLHFGWEDGGGWQGFGTAPLAWEAGTWYHVVFINDRAAGKTIIRSNDGVWATHEDILGPGDLRAPVTQVQIGGLNGSYRFTGCMDDVRLYDMALSEAEGQGAGDGRVRQRGRVGCLDAVPRGPRGETQDPVRASRAGLRPPRVRGRSLHAGTGMAAPEPIPQRHVRGPRGPAARARRAVPGGEAHGAGAQGWLGGPPAPRSLV